MPCDFPLRVALELGEKRLATPVVLSWPANAVMPELALKVRAVETLAVLFAVVPCATTMVIKSPTCIAL